MLIEMMREVTLPRYTLKEREFVVYRGNLKRQYSDRFEHYITIGGGKVGRQDFHIHSCDCEYMDMISGASQSHGTFKIKVCRICRRQKL